MIPKDDSIPGTFVVSDDLTLEHIRRHAAHFLGRGAYRHIEVTVPVDRRERFEHQINVYYRACGCFESGISVLLTIAALFTWNITFSNQQVHAWPDVLLDFGIVFLAAVLGKVFGIVRAHLALMGALHELARALGALNTKRGIQ